MAEVYIQFEYGQEDRISEEFGPFPFIQLTYDMVRTGEDGDDHIATMDPTDQTWVCHRDDNRYSDFVVFSKDETDEDTD